MLIVYTIFTPKNKCILRIEISQAGTGMGNEKSLLTQAFFRDFSSHILNIWEES